ncbi:MAG: ABC transporter substrate-binding protein [Paracoccaceae bacterium]
MTKLAPAAFAAKLAPAAFAATLTKTAQAAKLARAVPAAALAAALAAGPAAAQEEVRVGILFGFTGPIESLTPAMASGAELAMTEVSESGAFLDGASMTPVRADATCVDSAAAVSAAERLVTSDGVAAVVGAACSGATTAVLQSVALPNGVVMVSPASTSPALSEIEDDGLFFRTAPSDARQGEIVAEILSEKGVSSVAITYTNNDYGKGLADAIEGAFTGQGGEVTINQSHEDGKADYYAEVGALASAGGEVLVVAGYLDQGGRGIVQAALDTGAFDTFYLPDGMVGESLIEAIGAPLDGSYGANPGASGENADAFAAMAEEAGFEPGPYSGESYDAAALIALAMQKAGSTEPSAFKDAVMEVANEPGEAIGPGELGRALEILAEGGEVNYQGATNVELIGPGESAGSYREIAIEDGELVVVGYR